MRKLKAAAKVMGIAALCVIAPGALMLGYLASKAAVGQLYGALLYITGSAKWAFTVTGTLAVLAVGGLLMLLGLLFPWKYEEDSHD